MGAFVSEWGAFVDETPPSGGRPPPSPSTPVPRPNADDGWGDFDPPAGRTASPSPSAGVPPPSPEVVASLLIAGETLWAHVEGPVAVLGSGCTLTAVYDGEPDGFRGWRPVTVLDPARLIVRPVALSLAEPPVGAATSVAELYSDPERPSTGEPRRAAPFPVGQGPDMYALLNRAVAEERELVRAKATAAAHRIEMQLEAAKRELAERAELAERQARMREEQAGNEVRRALQEAERQARAHEEHARNAVRRAHQEAERQVFAANAETQRQIAAARTQASQAAQVVRHWQIRAQQGEGDSARLTDELHRANRTGVQRLVLVGVLAVIAVVLTFLLMGA